MNQLWNIVGLLALAVEMDSLNGRSAGRTHYLFVVMTASARLAARAASPMDLVNGTRISGVNEVARAQLAVNQS